MQNQIQIDSLQSIPRESNVKDILAAMLDELAIEANEESAKIQNTPPLQLGSRNTATAVCIPQSCSYNTQTLWFFFLEKHQNTATVVRSHIIIIFRHWFFVLEKHQNTATAVRSHVITIFRQELGISFCIVLQHGGNDITWKRSIIEIWILEMFPRYPATLEARGFLREEPQSAISVAWSGEEREKIDKSWENLWSSSTRGFLSSLLSLSCLVCSQWKKTSGTRVSPCSVSEGLFGRGEDIFGCNNVRLPLVLNVVCIW